MPEATSKSSANGRPKSARGACRGYIAAAIVIIILTGLSGCGDDPGAATGGHGDGDALFPRLPRVTGHIDEVSANPENPRHFRTLRITDSEGRHWRFQAEGWVGVSSGHLKDHQIQGTTVTVWYEKRSGGGMLARFVSD